MKCERAPLKKPNVVRRSKSANVLIGPQAFLTRTMKTKRLQISSPSFFGLDYDPYKETPFRYYDCGASLQRRSLRPVSFPKLLRGLGS